MAKRKIITIDENKCTGCKLCIPSCPEGALQIIDGKARLISDLFCDGLGACIGHCPEGAITIEEREAESYDEKKTMENIVKGGKNVIKAHLEHLRDHGQMEYLMQAVNYLKENNIENPMHKKTTAGAHAAMHGCPGSKMMDFSKPKKEVSESDTAGARPSELQQWPIQLHLVSPLAPYFQGADVVLSADCVAFSIGDFHKDYLKGKKLAIACPKLDSEQEVYIEKITALIDQAKINTLTVMIMQVPCCRGLLNVVLQGAAKASRKVPIKSVIVGIQGDILSEEWVSP